MSKKILLLIAILAIGIIIIPATVSLFAGEHNWYDTMQNGNQVPCEKCHGDIATELSQPGTTNLVHKVMGCEQCHVTTAPNSEGLTQGVEFHAAATTSCMDCHNTTLLFGTFDHSTIVTFLQSGQLGCLTCHRNPQSFPSSFSAVSIFTGPSEVHKDFVNGSKNSSLLKDSNEACISCHTHIRVNITWSRKETIAFNASINTGIWSLSNFTGEGKNVTKTSG